MFTALFNSVSIRKVFFYYSKDVDWKDVDYISGRTGTAVRRTRYVTGTTYQDDVSGNTPQGF